MPFTPRRALSVSHRVTAMTRGELSIRGCIPEHIGTLCIKMRQAGVEMPIVQQMCAVLFEGKDPRQAVLDLMQREPKTEF